MAAIALLWGTWHFLVGERMKKYRDDRERLDQLSEKCVALSERFAEERPAHVVGVYEEQVAPWEFAVESRSRFFTSDHKDKVPKVPDEDLALIRIWYEEQIAAAIRSLQEDMASKLYQLPPVNFDVPTAATLYDREVNQFQALIWLTRQERGAAMVRRLLDADVPVIRSVQMSKGATPMALFNVTFFVLAFDADFGTLAGLLNDFTRGDIADVQEGEHFYNVSGIQIHNPNLSYSRPVLRVQMVVAEAEYNPRLSVLPQASPDERLDLMEGPGRKPKETTWWQRFRNNWLPF